MLSLVFFTPLVGAAALLVVSGRRPAAIKWLANAFAAAAFVGAVPLWFLYDPLGKTWQFAERGPSLPAIGASFYLGVDGFSMALVLLTTLVGWIAMLASWNEIEAPAKGPYVSMLVLEAGVLGAFMALDFLLFFVSLATALAAMSCIMRVRTFLTVTLAASVCLLFGILSLYSYNHSVTGVSTFDITQYQFLDVPPDVQAPAFVALFLGFAAMVPILPLLGTYGLIRFCLPILPHSTVDFAPAIALVAIAASLCSGVMALAQRDGKRLIAYSSLNQISLAILATFALTPAGLMGSLVQQIACGISLSALLLIARRQMPGVVQNGLWRSMPRFATVFLIASVSAVALAALNVLPPVYARSRWWAVAATAGIVLAAGSWLRLYGRTVARQRDSNAPPGDLTAREVATLAPLVVIAIWIALDPAPLLRRLETSVGRVAIRIDPAYGATVTLGSDCATPAKPDPAGPPPVFVLAEPCADGSDAASKPGPPSDGPRR
jgi:NADH-quinone oxidoreductase subunit M